MQFLSTDGNFLMSYRFFPKLLTKWSLGNLVLFLWHQTTFPWGFNIERPSQSFCPTVTPCLVSGLVLWFLFFLVDAVFVFSSAYLFSSGTFFLKLSTITMNTELTLFNYPLIMPTITIYFNHLIRFIVLLETILYFTWVYVCVRVCTLAP